LLHDQIQSGGYAFFNLESWVNCHADELVIDEDLPGVACPVPANRGQLRLFGSRFKCAKVHEVECKQPGVILLRATVVLTLQIEADIEDDDYQSHPKSHPDSSWRKLALQHPRYPKVKSVSIETAVSVNMSMTIRGSHCSDPTISSIEGSYGRVAFEYRNQSAPPRSTESTVCEPVLSTLPIVQYAPR